jgi:hypothetical protein
VVSHGSLSRAQSKMLLWSRLPQKVSARAVRQLH